METEKTSHETEKSLILSQISATQHTDPLFTKHQNGDPSQQFNGDTNWSNFEPNTVVYPMKSQQENCSGPPNMQAILDQSMHEMNGQIKHALSEPTFLDFHQPKKLCTDSEMNGNEDLRHWDNRDLRIENHLERFPKHNKPGDFEIKHSKRNCNFPNGDLFLLSRNKPVPMANGATTSPPSVKGTTGDLLEKTLSQYYPEHVSIAPQTNSSQVDQVTSNLPEQETPSPSLTSGFPISPQTSVSEPLAKAPPEVQGSNGYNPGFTVNGYSSFVAEQKKPTYPLSDLPDMGTQLLSQEASESSVPSQTGINGCSQIKKARKDPPNDSDCLSKSNHDFSRESYILPPVMAGAPSQNTQTGQQNLQIKVLQKQPTNESLPNNRDLSLPQQQILEPHIVDSRLTSNAFTSASHNQHSEQKNKPKPDQEKMISENTDHSSQIKWIDLNSASAPQLSTDHPQMWDIFLPQTHMQQHTVTQNQSHCINSMSSNNFRSQNFSNTSCPSFENKTQDSYKNSIPPTKFPHNSVPDCQQNNSGMQNHSNMQFNKHMSQQLCKNDQDQIQSQSFLSQPAPAEPHPQDNSTFPHQLPQDRQNMQAAPQSQDVSHSQVDAPLLKRLKTEGCLHSESQKLSLGTETPAQTLSFPTTRENSKFPGFSKSNVQFLTKEAEVLTERKLQQNMQYSQNTSKQHPNYQQPLQHRVHNHLEFPQSPISQSQLSQISTSLQIPAQIFTKAEVQEPFVQIHREFLPSQGAQGDLQRHAALRMYLMQRQEREGPNNIRPSMPVIKSETSAQLPPIEVKQQDQDKIKFMPVVVKQEHPSSSCEQSKQRSILATMEQQLKQYQLSPVFERKSLVNKLQNKVKVEMAGAVTVLSTSAEGNVKEQCKLQNFTPPKKIEPGLQTFLESPMKMLDTPIKNLLDTPLKTQYDISSCHCVGKRSYTATFSPVFTYCVLFIHLNCTPIKMS